MKLEAGQTFNFCSPIMQKRHSQILAGNTDGLSYGRTNTEQKVMALSSSLQVGSIKSKDIYLRYIFNKEKSREKRTCIIRIFNIKRYVLFVILGWTYLVQRTHFYKCAIEPN